MPCYRVTGKVYLTVISYETERIDITFEASDESHARTIAEGYACEQQSGDDVDINYSDLTIALVAQTAEEVAEEESLAIYRAMQRMKAPQLPGMATY